MINLFASKSDWMQSTGNGEITFDDSGITMTPINTIGTAYVANKMGQGKISFTYQVEYAQGVDPFKSDQDNYQVFFGVLFSNSPANIVSPNAALSIPWEAPAGIRTCWLSTRKCRGMSRTGQTGRSYPAPLSTGGSHDYTRWSSVERRTRPISTIPASSMKARFPLFISL